MSMSESMQARRVIPGREVRRDDAPVLVDGGATSGARGSMAVIPLTEAGEIRGFEVRCPCGCAVIVECVYDGDAQERSA